MNFVTDPRLFNNIIIALYLAAALRWAYAGHWWTAAYWLSALAITVTVTYGKLN